MTYSDQTTEIKYYERTFNHCKSNAKRHIHEPEGNFILPVVGHVFDMDTTRTCGECSVRRVFAMSLFFKT